jgi:exonuclease SbcC
MCHKKNIIEFHQGVNMFIGLSEHGKSAIFNSLYKVMTNRPLGDEWRSWWGGDSVIKLNLDKNSIIYEKSKKTNEKGQYTLINKEEDETTYDAVGTTVPQDIIDLLKIDRKINIQKQLERGVPIFLISESPGDVAKFFNKVAGLYKIDETRAAGKTDLKSTEQVYITIEAALKEKKDDLKKYDNVDSLMGMIKEAEKKGETINVNNNKRHTIMTHLDEIIGLRELIKEKEGVLKTENKIDEAINLKKEIKETEEQRIKIDYKLKQTRISKHKINKYQRSLKVSPKINKAVGLLETFNLSKSKLGVLNRQFIGLNSVITKIDTLHHTLSETALEFNKLMPEVCPLCSSPVKGILDEKK